MRSTARAGRARAATWLRRSRTLDGGEEIPCGRFNFRVIWTPGHSAGHICLYDTRHKVLLSGDHVLPRITPSVGLHVRSTGNPLADYLDSLKLIGKLEAELDRKSVV